MFHYASSRRGRAGRMAARAADAYRPPGSNCRASSSRSLTCTNRDASDPLGVAHRCCSASKIHQRPERQRDTAESCKTRAPDRGQLRKETKVSVHELLCQALRRCENGGDHAGNPVVLRRPTCSGYRVDGNAHYLKVTTDSTKIIRHPLN
jgi:hypothetical protein